MDGPFYKVGSIIADIMLLSLFWFIFSIPIFTIGTSTTALYYVMTRRITNRDGYLFRDFWHSFKSNFKQTTLIWLMLILVVSILAINIKNIDLVGNMKLIVLPVQICFLIELSLMFVYVFAINSRFEVKLRESLKFAFFMANRHIPTSIACILIGAAIVLASYIYPLLILVAIGIYVYLTSFLLLRVFKKYRPEIAQEEWIGESANLSGGYHDIQINSQTLSGRSQAENSQSE
jgi:uncharacterized membrane protein YesL